MAREGTIKKEGRKYVINKGTPVPAIQPVQHFKAEWGRLPHDVIKERILKTLYKKQKEIAKDLGITTHTVRRYLKELKNEGKIKKANGKYILA